MKISLGTRRDRLQRLRHEESREDVPLVLSTAGAWALIQGADKVWVERHLQDTTSEIGID